MCTGLCSIMRNNISIVNSLWPGDAIWRHRSWLTLAQTMACCLTAPSHYLNKCWLIIHGILWHSPDTNFTGNAQNIHLKMSLKITLLTLFPQLIQRGPVILRVIYQAAHWSWFIKIIICRLFSGNLLPETNADVLSIAHQYWVDETWMTVWS